MRKLLKRKWILLVAALLLVSGYLAVFGLPPYSEGSSRYPGQVSGALDSEIKQRMAEISRSYPNPRARKLIGELLATRLHEKQTWTSLDGALNLSVIPYVETATHSPVKRVRYEAYTILHEIGQSLCVSGFDRETVPDTTTTISRRYSGAASRTSQQ